MVRGIEKLILLPTERMIVTSQQCVYEQRKIIM